MNAKQIIDKFGGVRAMQAALGHPYETTVRYWYNRGGWPRWRCDEILAAARKLRLGITLEQVKAARRGGK